MISPLVLVIKQGENTLVSLDKSDTYKNESINTLQRNKAEEELIHEHYFSTIKIGKLSCLLCLSCDRLFCESCGKSIDRMSIQDPAMHGFICRGAP